MTKFLREAARETQGRRWVRELAILLLRTGTIFFALMSLTRPYAPLSLPLPPAPTAIALIIDNSLSMRSRISPSSEISETYFDRSLKLCERLLREAKSEAALFVADKASGPACDFATNLSQKMKILRRIRPTFKALDLTPALQSADALLTQRPATLKRIFVFTDLQSEPFKSLHLPDLRNPLTVVDVKPSDRTGNARLLAKLCLPLDPQSDGKIAAKLQNMGNLPLNGALSAEVNGKNFTLVKISLPTGGQTSITFPLPSWVLSASDEGGLIEVEIRWRAEHDVFEWDDFVKFVFKSPKEPLVINAVREGRHFIEAALRATGITHFSPIFSNDADALITSAPADPKTASQLMNWLKRGKTALVIADNLTSPLWSMLGLLVKSERSPQKERIRWVDENNPILRDLGVPLRTVTVQPFATVQIASPKRSSPRTDPIQTLTPTAHLLSQAFKPLITLTNGAVLLGELPVGSGRCFLLTIPLSPERSDLIYSPAFVPLIHRFVRFAVHGHELSPKEEEAKPRGELRVSTTVPKSESDFRLLPRGDVEIELKKFGGTLITADQLSKALIPETELRDLTSPCLSLALLCLLSESLLSFFLWRRAK